MAFEHTFFFWLTDNKMIKIYVKEGEKFPIPILHNQSGEQTDKHTDQLTARPTKQTNKQTIKHEYVLKQDLTEKPAN